MQKLNGFFLVLGHGTWNNTWFNPKPKRVRRYGMRIATEQDCAGYDCLKSYIDRAEAAYSWTDLGNTLEVPDLGGGGGGWTGFVLNMTSQTWMSPDLGQWESHLR